MYLWVSINVLTLLAIVPATGLVVDDGIVMKRKISTVRSKGMNKWQAAQEGSKEIFFAVLATSDHFGGRVFYYFLQGFVGRLFGNLEFVVAGAVLISCLVFIGH